MEDTKDQNEDKPTRKPSSKDNSPATPSPSARCEKLLKKNLSKFRNIYLQTPSILLISPQNTILLLHRVTTSTAFASAHVFPGGHISLQDGDMPPVEDPRRHQDSTAYRMGAIRECFEESGILLGRDKSLASGALLNLTDEEREKARHAIHAGKTTFSEWLETVGGRADLDSLAPFTRWLTPLNAPRRYSTQMYLYFLPLSSSPDLPSTVHTPTSDGGIEHTTAEFQPVTDWLSQYRANEIILFPPQLFLLSVLAPFLDPVPDPRDFDALNAQRSRLVDFWRIQEYGEPSWPEKCISPYLMWKDGQRFFIALDKAGPELSGTGRRGDGRRVITWILRDGRQRSLEVRWKEDVIKERQMREGSGVQEDSREQPANDSAQGDRREKERL